MDKYLRFHFIMGQWLMIEVPFLPYPKSYIACHKGTCTWNGIFGHKC